MGFFKNLSRHTASIFVALLCLVVVVGLWVGLTLHLALDRERLIESKRQENDNLAKLFAEHVTRTVRAGEVVIKEIEEKYIALGWRPFDLVRYREERSLFLDPSNVVAVLDETGERIMTSIPPKGPANYRKGETFQHHLKGESSALYISKPRIGKASGRWTIYLSHRLEKSDGSFGGVVNYGLDPAYFSSVFAEMDLGAGGVASLVGRDGIVRARHAGKEFSAGQDVTDTPLFREQLPVADHGNFVRKSPLDGITRIFSYRALENYPLVVLIGTSETVALANHEVRKSNYILAGSGISVVILCLGIFGVFMIRKADTDLRAVNADLENRVEKRTDELRQAQAELVKKERLAALGQLAASVSHELRNPLGAMSTSVAVLRAKLDGTDSAVDRSIDRIRRSVDRCDRIIGEMLDYAKDRELAAAPTNIDGWLREVLAEHEFPDDIELELQLNMEGARVEIDSELLRRAIINLCDNACDAMRASPPSEHTHVNTLRIETHRKGDCVEIVVADNGPGMPEEVLANSFEPLYSTKSFGVGLGLPIVKQILEQHNGDVTVESRPDEGARMTLTLPLNRAVTETCQIA